MSIAQYSRKYKRITSTPDNCLVRDKGVGICLGILPMLALDITAEFVPKIMKICVDLCSECNVKIRLVLFDRELFSTESINSLDDAGVPYLMPCTNTPNVKSALRGFAEKKMPRVSKNVIKSDSASAKYTMIVTRRKKAKGSAVPYEKYIAFATNSSDVRVQDYVHRWGIENGYKSMETMRAKTRSRRPASRFFCFAYSILMYNAWIMDRAYMEWSGRLGHAKILTQNDFRFMLERTVFNCWMVSETEPPPYSVPK